MKANAALAYCHKKYVKSLNNPNAKLGNQVTQSFIALEEEIKKLDFITQLHLYSATTQLLEHLINDPKDTINPLEVFDLRCQSILATKYSTCSHILLGLATIGIACAAIATGGALGIGIGILAGLWQTPLIYMAAVMALELPAVGVAALSATVGLGAGMLSGFLFFKEPKVVRALNHCVEAIKEGYLEESQDNMEKTEPVSSMN